MYNHYYGPWNARLQARNRGQTRGGWIAKYRNRKQWLQVDLGVVTRIKRIATQGRYDANQWVKSYTLSYSNNGIRFIPYRRGRRVQVIGNFSFEDGNDSENITFKMNSRFFKLCRVHSSLLKMSNVGVTFLGIEFLGNVLSLDRERKNPRRLFTSCIKREIRLFHVVVV